LRFRFYVGGTRENTKDLAELERLPGCAASRCSLGSSTGSLLVEDDDGVRNILKSIRRRSAYHSEDEYRLRERKDMRVDDDPRSHRSGATRSWRCNARSAWSRSRTRRPAHPRAAHHLRAGDGVFGRPQGRRSVEVTPHHLTLAAPECYERLGTLAQMNPPVRDATHRAALWRGLDRAWSTCSAPTTRPIRATRRPSRIRRARPA